MSASPRFQPWAEQQGRNDYLSAYAAHADMVVGAEQPGPRYLITGAVVGPYPVTRLARLLAWLTKRRPAAHFVKDPHP